jgi:hypothetical protein
MTILLHQMPFAEQAEEVAVGTERVRVRPYQILIWVSLSAKRVMDLPPTAARFPAILDTGHNHNFSLRCKHLDRWARIDPDQLPGLGTVREGGRRATLYPLNVWLHCNKPGERDRFANRPAYCLELPQGVAVYPDEVDSRACRCLDFERSFTITSIRCSTRTDVGLPSARRIGTRSLSSGLDSVHHDGAVSDLFPHSRGFRCWSGSPCARCSRRHGRGSGRSSRRRTSRGRCRRRASRRRRRR